ncbi:MAG: thiosulfohydrolase SoxB [Gammaproteobacteria bacterium]|nr:thiosulfohydrolase SoxB [Gammaproteobacteria bacterium]
MNRREFLQILAAGSAAGLNLARPGRAATIEKEAENLYDFPAFGNVSLLHFTDCHGQLLPVWFREPSINLGLGDMYGKPPHLAGRHLLKHFNLREGSLSAHAYTHLDFVELARKYGKTGGFAHLAALVKNLREQRPGALLLDGGDTWGGGGATAIWTNARDMVEACLLLGVDVMTGHWEFIFGAKRVREILENEFAGKNQWQRKIDFIAQNVVDAEWSEQVFKPYVIRKINQVPVAIIGQAFPYTPIANPRYMIPDWSFGIREESMQKTVDSARGNGAQAVVVLSHNGMDVDLKMASRVTGIDAILGGHTHDGVPRPISVSNAGGKTLVINSGSHGKFLSVLDLEVKNGKVRDFRFKLLPVFANLIPPDPAMSRYIDKMRAPFKNRLEEKLAVSEDLLYRRGNFNGTFDEVILDAIRTVKGAEIALSPGVRWGTAVMPGEHITFEHVMSHTALTYPAVTLRDLTGARIKIILEEVADNIFNKDPYYQQGGDMVRVGGMQYSIDPSAAIGRRISDMELNGKPLDPAKHYRVGGWANVAEPIKGTPCWDVVAEYLRDRKTVRVKAPNVPRLKNVSGNPGLS